MPKNQILLVMAAAMLLCLAYVLYRSWSSGSRLNVEPHAAKEIEKAKRQ